MMEKMNPVVEQGRRMWLAGLGAVALAQDEILDFANRLVERGAITEQDSKKLVQDLMEWPQKGYHMAEGEIQHQVDTVLGRMGILTKTDLAKMDLPTKGDIDALAEKVVALSKKVDELRKLEKQQKKEIETIKAA